MFAFNILRVVLFLMPSVYTAVFEASTWVTSMYMTK